MAEVTQVIAVVSDINSHCIEHTNLVILVISVGVAGCQEFWNIYTQFNGLEHVISLWTDLSFTHHCILLIPFIAFIDLSFSFSQVNWFDVKCFGVY